MDIDTLKTAIKSQLDSWKPLASVDDAEDIVFSECDLLEKHAEECGIEIDSNEWLEMRDLQHDVCRDFSKKIAYSDFSPRDFKLASESGSIYRFETPNGLLLDAFKGDDNEAPWVNPINFEVVMPDDAPPWMEFWAENGILNIDAAQEICFEKLNFEATQ